jgi:hypothetical protein
MELPDVGEMNIRRNSASPPMVREGTRKKKKMHAMQKKGDENEIRKSKETELQ